MTGGPLLEVLGAVRAGAVTTLQIRDRTGLREETVRAALDQLQRLRLLAAPEIPRGCPPSGCGRCAVSSSCPAG